MQPVAANDLDIMSLKRDTAWKNKPYQHFGEKFLLSDLYLQQCSQIEKTGGGGGRLVSEIYGIEVLIRLATNVLSNICFWCRAVYKLD